VTITAIEPQKRNKKRVSVFVDGRYSFSLDRELAVALKLREGEEIDGVRLQQIVTESEQQKAMDASLNLLSFRGRSIKEMGDRLKHKGFDDAVITRTTAKLREYSLLDDIKFAEAVARDRLEFAHKGKRQIYADLRKRGVPKPVIEKVLSEAGSEDKAACAVVTKAARRYAALPPKERYRKLSDLLLRRGFSFDTVNRVLARQETAALEQEASERPDM
jgi:regulatory protein